MHRISRDRLFHRIVSDIKFDRRMPTNLRNDQIYQIAERFTELVCTGSIMVVEASIPHFGAGAAGTFGKDEPWPDWVNRRDLQMKGLVGSDSTSSDLSEPER